MRSSQKRRGKRPSPDATHSEPATEPALKKVKVDAPLSEYTLRSLPVLLRPVTLLDQYEKEVKSYTPASLKDVGTGVRPLVK